MVLIVLFLVFCIFFVVFDGFGSGFGGVSSWSSNGFDSVFSWSFTKCPGSPFGDEKAVGVVFLKGLNFTKVPLGV